MKEKERQVEKEKEEEEEVAEVNALMGEEEIPPIEAQSDSDMIRKAKKRRIIIHNQEGPGGDQSVFVAVNGMAYNIPRDKPVMLPMPIIEALKNASETRYVREQDSGKDFGPVTERQVQRFPFSILEGER